MNSVLTEEETVSSQRVDWFHDLYSSARDDVYAYVAGLLRDPTSAEDVTASAFERAFRKQKSFDATRGSARAWLFGIARNAALDELRRRKRVAALTVEPSEADSAIDGVEASFMRTAVKTAMKELDPHEQELVVLKFHGGLSNGELAELLGMSHSNVGTKLHRVMNKLREACHG